MRMSLFLIALISLGSLSSLSSDDLCVTGESLCVIKTNKCEIKLEDLKEFQELIRALKLYDATVDIFSEIAFDFGFKEKDKVKFLELMGKLDEKTLNRLLYSFATNNNNYKVIKAKIKQLLNRRSELLTIEFFKTTINTKYTRAANNITTGRRQAPCVVKQISGPDGDGSFSPAPHKHKWFGYTHKIKDARGKHGLGHTWLSCKIPKNKLTKKEAKIFDTSFIAKSKIKGAFNYAFGFYPATYKNVLISSSGKVLTSDAMDAETIYNFDGSVTSHDWEWITEVPLDSPDKYLRYGKSAGVKCSDATDVQIVDCVMGFSEATTKSKKRWDATHYNCQDFVLDSMHYCCIEKGKRIGPRREANRPKRVKDKYDKDI